MKNPLQALQDQGQSVWLDDLHRGLITSGELARMIEKDGLRGLTSNPSIFEKAIVGGSEYRDMIEALESQGLDAKTLYERIMVRDIQDAADVLHPVYLESKGRDGYVSLEVSPRLAHDSLETIEEARRLWLMVARENVMIKIPGTQEGVQAIQQLISEGINVNATLLFSQEAYEQVAEAYLDGLENLVRQGGDLSKVASVASFFISRIDTAVDNLITERLKTTRHLEEQALLGSLLGRVAIASAKNTYKKYLGIFSGNRWQELSQHGARTQRLLWASTGTKNPDYLDVVYIEELIGPDTINTMPPATLEAFRDHGHVQATLTNDVEEAIRTMDLIEQAGIPFKMLTGKLLAEGLKQFKDAYAKSLKATDRRGKAYGFDPISFLSIKLFRELFLGRQHS